MQTPKFLRDLLQSDSYWDKNSDEFAKANEYLEILFPGQLQKDITGQYIKPEYDMTYEQFLTAQKKFDNDLEEAIIEAESDEGDASNEFQYIDIRQFVEIAEIIDVLVLMPDGNIETNQLIVYKLNIPETSNEYLEPTKKIWIWHSEDDDRICDDCASHDGEVFENKDDIPEIPLHQNCRCWVEEQELDEKSKPISNKVYKGQKPENKTDTNEEKDMKMSDDTKKFDQAYNNLKEREGGYTTGKNQKKDEPTNMGIKQSTLDKYSAKYPDKNFPQDVKDLKEYQAKEIYKSEYWDNTRIPQIENDRIRNAVFDMNVMGGAGKVVQRAINSFSDANFGEESIWRFPVRTSGDFSDKGVTSNLSTESTTLYRNQKRESAYNKVSVQQNMVVEKTPEKRAAETADMILKIRQQRFQIVTGDTDATYSGEAMGAAIDELTRLEQEYMTLFVGYSEYQTQRMRFEVIPEADRESQMYIAFRLSDDNGLVAADNLSGRPVVMEIVPQTFAEPEVTAAVDPKAAKAEVYYRIPAMCSVKLINSGDVIMQSRIPVYQLGRESSLPANVILNGDTLRSNNTNSISDSICRSILLKDG